MRALAVTSAQRSPALPDVPSMGELGFNDFNVLNYFGLVAPRATPQAVLDKLNAAVAKAVSMPDVKTRFANDAIGSATGTPAALSQFIARYFNGWRQVVTAQGLKIDAA